MLHLSLSPAWSHFLYHLGMFLGLAVPVALSWSIGRKKGFPPGVWLVTLTIFTGLLLIGSRLGGMDSWADLFDLQYWQREAPRSVIGGVLLALAGYGLLKKWFRLPPAAADALLIGLPLGGVFARLGCMSAGCCYGLPSGGWCSMSFGPGSPAFEAQVAGGQISEYAAASLPLYPVQLGLSVSNLLIFIVLWKFRNRFRPGNLALAAIMMLAVSRFGSEFFRDVATNGGATGQVIFGLKLAQWVPLIFAVIALWWWKFRRAASSESTELREQPAFILAAVIFPMALLAWVFRYRMGFFENALFFLMLMPSIAVVGAMLWRQSGLAERRQPALALLSGALIAQLATQVDTLAPGADAGRTWWELGTGYSISRFKDYDETFTSSNGSSYCGTTTVNRNREIREQAGSVVVSYHALEENKRNHLWATGKVDFIHAETLDGFPANKGNFVSWAVSGNWESKGFGFSIGVLNAPKKGIDLVGSSKKDGRTFVTAGLRIGNYWKYSFDVRLLDRHEFLPYRFPSFSVGFINWGFRDVTGRTHLRLGLASTTSEASIAPFASLRTPILNDQLTIESGLYLGKNKNYAFSLGARYMLE